MDFKSFFIALKENGNTGGLFVAVILGVFFTVIFWKLALGLIVLGLALKFLIWTGRGLSGMSHSLFSPILFFLVVAAVLFALAIPLREFLSIDAFQLIIPIETIVGITYSLCVLKFYLSLSLIHKFVYFVIPAFFSVALWMQFKFDHP